jgi:hypothetical protein
MALFRGEIEDCVSHFAVMLAFSEVANSQYRLAPLDLPRQDAASQMLALYKALTVPREFTVERVQSVSHSFGSMRDAQGTCSWFHFLCKNIEVNLRGRHGQPEVDNRAARMGFHPAESLPQADYSWHRSGFFLRRTLQGNITLVCFGATPKVVFRLGEFIEARSWSNVAIEPYMLFDLILEGLYREVDATVWSMGTVFGPLEHVSESTFPTDMAFAVDLTCLANFDLCTLQECAEDEQEDRFRGAA